MKTVLSRANFLDLDGSLKSLSLLLGTLVGLLTHDTTSPLAAGVLGVGHVAILDGRDELGELALVLGADLGDGEDSSGLGRFMSVFMVFLHWEFVLHTFLWTTVPRRALPLMMA